MSILREKWADLQLLSDRYPLEAYLFVLDGLRHTREILGVVGHVSGQELLLGIRQFAVKRYGPMVLSVFRRWGIYATSDIGKIVFNMVEVGIISKTQDDELSDFNQVYDIDELFSPIKYDYLDSHIRDVVSGLNDDEA